MVILPNEVKLLFPTESNHFQTRTANGSEKTFADKKGGRF